MTILALCLVSKVGKFHMWLLKFQRNFNWVIKLQVVELQPRFIKFERKLNFSDPFETN